MPNDRLTGTINAMSSFLGGYQKEQEKVKEQKRIQSQRDKMQKLMDTGQMGFKMGSDGSLVIEMKSPEDVFKAKQSAEKQLLELKNLRDPQMSPYQQEQVDLAREKFNKPARVTPSAVKEAGKAVPWHSRLIPGVQRGAETDERDLRQQMVNQFLPQGQQGPQIPPIPPPDEDLIRVRVKRGKQKGKTGTISPGEFDPNIYERL